MSISLNNFTCPHCLKENTTIEDVSIFRRKVSKNISVIFCCKSCDKNIVFDLDEEASRWFGQEYEKENNYIFTVNDHYKNVFINDIYIGGYNYYYPEPQNITLPEYLSDAVSKNFREAKELFQKRYFNPSGMTSRRVVDLATKELLPEHTGMLNGRIKELLKNNIVTKQLSDWADIIRLDGNSANHDYDDFTEEEAEQLLDFTEMFLMYVFTLPKMVEIKIAKNPDKYKSINAEK